MTYSHAGRVVGPWTLYVNKERTIEPEGWDSRPDHCTPSSCHPSWSLTGKTKGGTPKPLSLHCPPWPSVQVNASPAGDLQDKRTSRSSGSQMIKVSSPSTFSSTEAFVITHALETRFKHKFSPAWPHLCLADLVEQELKDPSWSSPCYQANSNTECSEAAALNYNQKLNFRRWHQQQLSASQYELIINYIFGSHSSSIWENYSVNGCELLWSWTTGQWTQWQSMFPYSGGADPG